MPVRGSGWWGWSDGGDRGRGEYERLGVRELSVECGQPCVVMPWRRASCRVAGGGSGGRAGSVGEMPRAAGVVVNLFLMQRIESGLVADASAMASSATARRVKSFVIVVVISGCLKQLSPRILVDGRNSWRTRFKLGRWTAGASRDRARIFP